MSAEVPIREPAAPSAVHLTSVKGFLRWWREELIALLPSAWRDRLQSRGATPVVAAEGGWRMYAHSRGALIQEGLVDPSGNGATAAGRLRHANAWLLLRPDEVVMREAVLPLAAEEALDDALGFELDRLTPLPAERAYFGYRVTARNEPDGQLRVRLGVAPREGVDRHVSALRAAGARVLGVGLLEEYADGPQPLNVLPVAQRDRPWVTRVALATRILAGLAVVLAVAALVYPVWLKRESVIALLPRVDKARSAGEISSRLAGQIEALAKEHNFILAKKHGQTPMVVLVEELSRQLPDNTWVQQLELKPGPKAREVQIAGETGSSSALVEVLERSGLFANATFKSPLTKGATPNTERYLLAAELKAREVPAPLADDALRPAGPGSPAAPAAPAATAPPSPAALPEAAPPEVARSAATTRGPATVAPK